MQCPRCDRAVADTDTTCSGCGQSLGAGAASSGERPAHLAILDGAAAPAARAPSSSSASAPARAPSSAGAAVSSSAVTAPAPKPRLVSRAGPAVPSTPVRDDDAVPGGTSGWMARLEAAKRTPGTGSQPEPPARAASSSGAIDAGADHALEARGPAVPPPLPPPLPSKAKAPPAPEVLSTKPAHLLVAELEAAEREKREAKQRKTTALGTVQDEISKSEIANVEIPKPITEVEEKHIPKWVYAVAVVLVLGGALGAYMYADKTTPAIKAEADPELRAKAERARKANAAVEEGHAALEAKDPAKAIEAYLRALQIDPAFARAERALGVAYAAKGDDAAAAEHYQKFLALDPTAPEASQIRAIVEKYEASRKKP